MALQSKLKRVISRILKGVGVTLLTAIVVGIIYEEVGRKQDRKGLPQIGQSVNIGGRSLNIYCSGEGNPAVIFDTGSGEPGYAWSNIQPEIAKFTRACWYDRAGEGWSDPGPYPRTSADYAKDLHELLNRAGVPSPYVLVGASVGGLNVRVYNGLFTSEVAGMVLVDSAHEDEPKRAPQFMLGHTLPRYLWYPLHLLVQGATRVGLVRLLTPSAQLPEGPSQRTREQIIEALRRQPKCVAASAGNASGPESYAQAHSAAGLGDRPLIVLTAGRPILSNTGDPEIDKQAAAYHQVWMHEMQAQLARLSTRGRQVIVKSSGHRISEEAPEAVIDAVRDVVTLAREDRSKSSALPR
jgi:pimeloyl-ACP methyl ester carboxylesterase